MFSLVADQLVGAPTIAADGLGRADVMQVLRCFEAEVRHAPRVQRGLQQAHHAQRIVFNFHIDLARELADQHEGRHFRVERYRLERVDAGQQAVVLYQQHGPVAGDVKAGIDAHGLIFGTGVDHAR